MSSCQNKSNWILNATADSLFVVGPPFIILCLIFLFPGYFMAEQDVSPFLWILVVLGVDVSHVYSTLFRTYFEPATFQKHKTILTLVPVLVWVMGVLCYSIDSLLFWHILAYLAVFHFIRQQYGFLRIYVQKEERPRWFTRLENTLVYTITVIPVLIWHLSGDRSFVWFVKDDFFIQSFSSAIPVLQFVLFATIAAYAMAELSFCLRQKVYNTAKYLLLTGTFISWYFGIVYFNSDLIFTLFNVICHGVPYIMLIWVYGNKKTNQQSTERAWYSFLFSYKGVLIYVFILLLLAYVEEGFWNSLIWNEHTEYFSLFSGIPSVSNLHLATFLVPLLSVPQVTHYIIDGFIWKIKDDQFDWKKYILG